MPYVEIENFKLFYDAGGAGEALVLVPGFAGGAWLWFAQIEGLSKHFRVLTFDPRGVARSRIGDEINTDVSLSTLASDIAALLDELKIARANVLGISFGGFVAQRFAVDFPERLDKLILACTSAGGRNHVAPDLEVLSAFVAGGDLNKSDRIRRFMIPAFTPEFAAQKPETVEKVCRLRELNVVPETVYAAQMNAALTFDFATRLSEIRAETLILTGDRDAVVPPQNSENLARMIPNAVLETVENGSHLFFIEKPDEFNRRVIDFIKNETADGRE